MPYTPNDEELRLICEGDATARTAFVQALAPTFRHAVRHVLRAAPPERVEDVLHEVWLEFFRDPERILMLYDPGRGCSLQSFLFRFARMRTVSVLRRRRLSSPRESGEEVDVADEAPGPDEAVRSRLDLQALLEALQRECAPDDWELFQLTFLEELPTDEVCARFGLKPAALAKRRQRLREQLQALRKRLQGGG